MVITHKAAALAAKQSRLLSFIPCESCGKRASSLAAAAVMGRDWEQPVSQQESIEAPRIRPTPCKRTPQTTG